MELINKNVNVTDLLEEKDILLTLELQTLRAGLSLTLLFIALLYLIKLIFLPDFSPDLTQFIMIGSFGYLLFHSIQYKKGKKLFNVIVTKDNLFFTTYTGDLKSYYHRIGKTIPISTVKEVKLLKSSNWLYPMISLNDIEIVTNQESYRIRGYSNGVFFQNIISLLKENTCEAEGNE